MVSNKGKPAKTLRKDQQNTSVIGLAKKKKLKKKPTTVVKTTLENPFALQWPDIDADQEREIVSQLESCFCDLKIPIDKPYWKKISRLPVLKRRQIIEEYKKTSLEKDGGKAYELVMESRSHLILGYNAVMRALEQNRLAGILIKKNLRPSFLGQIFLPGCINRCIPLVPVTDLDDLLKREEMLAVEHSVMVVGLKPSVQEPSCRFYPIYSCMRKVVRVQGRNQECSSSKRLEMENHVSIMSNKENRQISLATSNDSKLKAGETNVSKNKLTPEEISSYHLKRPGNGKRAFVPQTKKSPKIELEEDVIVFKPSITTTVQRKNQNLVDKEVPKIKKIPKKTPEVDFDFGFFIDTAGDEDMRVAGDEGKGVERNGDTKVAGEGIMSIEDRVMKKKKKVKPTLSKIQDGVVKKKKEVKPKLLKVGKMLRDAKPSVTYVSAKTRRVKNNPTRISNKRKQ